MRLSVFSVCVLVVAILGGCTHYQATASCRDIQKYKSEIGNLNIKLFSIGELIALHDSKGLKFGTHVGVVNFPTTAIDKDTSNQATGLTVQMKEVFDVSFSGTVPNSVQAQVKLRVGNGSKLSLKRPTREAARDAAGQVSKDAGLLDEMRKALASDPDVKFVVVSSVMRADSLDLSLDKAVSAGANVSVMKVAGGDATIDYQCNGVASFSGNQVPVFYGITAVKYDPSTSSAAPDNSPVNPGDYALTNTARL